MSKIPKLLNAERFKLMLLLIIIGIMQAAATISSLVLAKTVFDRVLMKNDPTTDAELAMIGGGLFLIALVIGSLTMSERIVAEKIGQSYAEAVRIKLYDKLVSLPQRALQNRSRGGIMLRFVGDLTAVRQWVSLGLARLTVIALTAIGALVALAFINVTLAATVAIVLLLGAGISMTRGKDMRTVSRESRRRMSRLAANINEKIGAISVIQAFGQSEREKKRIIRQSRHLRTAMVAKARAGGKIRGLSEGFASFASGSALLVGAIQVNLAQTSPGSVIAALTVISLLAPKMRDLGRVQEYWHSFSVSRQKMAEFLNIPSQVMELPDAPKLQHSLGQLEFKNVSSGILKDITVTANPGAVIAIVGSNGAGKTSLMTLVARLTDPDSGEILIDGHNIRHYSLASVRKLVGIAGPDFPLLRGTLERNLTYRRPGASDAERNRVNKLCGIDEIIATLPEGVKTRIAEGGVGLSTGQRQRIALARALLGNPPILLLDEADANLDMQAATIIDEVLENHNGTVLLITHRLERIAKADMVWFLDNGALLEAGRPEHVLQGSGPLDKLFGLAHMTPDHFSQSSSASRH